MAKAAVDSIFEPLGEEDEVMRYAGSYALPEWLAIVYLASNIVLNTLNFYWFGKMIETVRSRFREPRGGKKGKSEGVMVEGLADSEAVGEIIVEGAGQILGDGKVMSSVVSSDGLGTTVEVEKREVRKRRG